MRDRRHCHRDAELLMPPCSPQSTPTSGGPGERVRHGRHSWHLQETKVRASQPTAVVDFWTNVPWWWWWWCVGGVWVVVGGGEGEGKGEEGKGEEGRKRGTPHSARSFLRSTTAALPSSSCSFYSKRKSLQHRRSWRHSSCPRSEKTLSKSISPSHTVCSFSEVRHVHTDHHARASETRALSFR